MGYLLEYDETNPISIETYGKRLIGKTFQDICDEDDMPKAAVVRETENYEVKHENKKRKGGLGELVEERYFHYQSNNDARPDFDKAGVELKVTPYKINKNGSISAKERLILTMIDYCSVVNESFEESHMWAKARLILLVYYLYRQEIKNRLDYKIDYVQLFSPPEEDMKIIEHDFNVIKDKICAGKAHELSEGDTLYLGAATKAATSEDRREQPFSDELAKPRAFAFKNSYMTYVLNNYIVPGKKTYESIVEGNIEESFEDYVVKKIDEHCGSSELELCYKYEVNIDKKPKDLHSLLSIFRKKSTSMNQYLSKMKNIDEIRDDLKKGMPYLMNKVKFDKINWFFSEKDKEKVKYIYDIPLFSTWSQAEGMGNYDAVGYFFLDDELKILGWSIGCMILGSQYLEGRATPDIYKVHPSYMIPIHIFNPNDSLLKAEELSKFACCVK